MSAGVDVSRIKHVAGLLTIQHQQTSTLKPLSLDDNQTDWLRTIEANQRAICCKSRQVYISTASLLYVLCWAFCNPGLRAAVCVDTHPKAQSFIRVLRGWLDNLGEPPLTANRKRIVLQNGCEIEAHGVLSRSGDHSRFLRSGTYHLLYFSEFAFYDEAEALFASSSSSLTPDAKIIIESTSSGPGHLFYRLFYSPGWARRFYGFESHATYRARPNLISEHEWAEYQRLGFTRRDAAAYFHSKTRAEYPTDIWRAFIEYPITEAMAWTSVAGKFFTSDAPVIRYDDTSHGIKGFRVFQHPSPGEKYLIGYDPAWGTGGDNSAIAVVNRYTGQLAACWASNQHDIDRQSTIIGQIHQYYSSHRSHDNSNPVEILLVEKNAVGTGAAALLRKLNLPVLEITTVGGNRDLSKYQNFLSVKRALEKGNLAGDDLLAKEVDQLTRDERDRFTGPDDLISAIGFCLSWLQNNPATRPQALIDRSRVFVAPSFERQKFADLI